MMKPELSRSQEQKLLHIGIPLAVLIVCLFVWSLAQAQERKYAAPDLSEYYTSLMQPDNPKQSCCGDADRYFADVTEACTDADRNLVPTCAIVAIITDTGPDVFTLPNGKTIHRPHIPVGTRIPVPASKLRKNPQPNPTDRNIIFTGTSLYPYSFEPAVLG